MLSGVGVGFKFQFVLGNMRPNDPKVVMNYCTVNSHNMQALHTCIFETLTLFTYDSLVVILTIIILISRNGIVGVFMSKFGNLTYISGANDN